MQIQQIYFFVFHSPNYETLYSFFTNDVILNFCFNTFQRMYIHKIMELKKCIFE